MIDRDRLYERFLRQSGLEIRDVRYTGRRVHTAAVVRSLLDSNAFWEVVDMIEESRQFDQPGRPAEWPAWIHALYQFTINFAGGVEATERFYRNYWDDLRAIALTLWPEDKTREVPEKPLAANTFVKARCRRDQAGRGLDLKRIRMAALEEAVTNALGMGLGTDADRGSLTSPARARVLVGDATPIASMIQNRKTTRVDRATGEIISQRVDRDAHMVYNGGDKKTWGYSVAQFALASNRDGEHNRSQVLYRMVITGRPEGTEACDIIDEIVPRFGRDIQAVAYDGALRSVHFDRIMERHGLPVAGKIRADARETFIDNVAVDGGKKPKILPIYGYRGDAYTKVKDAKGQQTRIKLRFKKFDRRLNRPKDRYKAWGIYEVPDDLGGGTVKVFYLNPATRPTTRTRSAGPRRSRRSVPATLTMLASAGSAGPSKASTGR